MSKVEYSSNNSGGYWWLADKDWYALEAAGWEVEWRRNESNRECWMGALATRASRSGLTLDEAIAEFESATGQDADDPGCSCCGHPHYFSETAA